MDLDNNGHRHKTQRRSAKTVFDVIFLHPFEKVFTYSHERLIDSSEMADRRRQGKEYYGAGKIQRRKQLQLLCHRSRKMQVPLDNRRRLARGVTVWLPVPLPASPHRHRYNTVLCTHVNNYVLLHN